MKRGTPNVRVLVTKDSREAVMDAGGCISMDCHTDYYWAEAKPDQLRRIMAKPGVVVVGEIQQVPTVKFNK